MPIGQDAPVSEKPWWRRLDGRPPPGPQWLERSLVARAGLVGTVIFGGGFLLRIAFPDKLGYAPLWGLLAVPFVVALLWSFRQSRRP
jgi:hypothetical protein